MVMLQISIAQQSFIWPCSSRTITGNYGELRPNHFHAGLDLSTNHQHLKVLAVANGYVSRIRYNATGYGRCLYITHPNGKTTVYAHLETYNDSILKFVRHLQFTLRKNEIDTILPSSKFKVKSGQWIGLTGNSGGSSGPHLHFEIRDTKTEVPLNPARFLNYTDKTAPVITHFGFYDLQNPEQPTFIALYKNNTPNTNSIITVPTDKVGLAFAAHDLVTKKGNKNNVTSVKLYADNELIFSWQLDSIPFDLSRYINFFSEKSNDVKLQKCFTPACYPSFLYAHHKNNGLLPLKVGKPLQVKLECRDERGNSTVLKLLLSAEKTVIQKTTLPSGSCNEAITIKSPSVSFVLPAYSRFYLQKFFLSPPTPNNPRLEITPTTTLLTPALLAFHHNNLVTRQSILVQNENMVAPSRINDSVVFILKSTGTFKIEKDTVGPTIKLNYTKAPRKSLVVFHLNDSQSGIKEWHVYVDGQWTPADYDPRIQSLMVRLTPKQLKSGCKIKVIVKDKCLNMTELNTSIKN